MKTALKTEKELHDPYWRGTKEKGGGDKTVRGGEGSSWKSVKRKRPSHRPRAENPWGRGAMKKYLRRGVTRAMR